MQHYQPINLINSIAPSLDWDANGFAENQIPVDISEDEKQWRFIANLPGVSKQDVKVNVKNDNLTISAKLANLAAQSEGKDKATRVLRSERPNGTFNRVFRFATPADGKSVSANLQDGVLTIVINKVDSETNSVEIQ